MFCEGPIGAHEGKKNEQCQKHKDAGDIDNIRRERKGACKCKNTDNNRGIGNYRAQNIAEGEVVGFLADCVQGEEKFRQGGAEPYDQHADKNRAYIHRFGERNAVLHGKIGADQKHRHAGG